MNKIHFIHRLRGQCRTIDKCKGDSHNQQRGQQWNELYFTGFGCRDLFMLMCICWTWKMFRRIFKALSSSATQIYSLPLNKIFSRAPLGQGGKTPLTVPTWPTPPALLGAWKSRGYTTVRPLWWLWQTDCRPRGQCVVWKNSGIRKFRGQDHERPFAFS